MQTRKNIIILYKQIKHSTKNNEFREYVDRDVTQRDGSKESQLNFFFALSVRQDFFFERVCSATIWLSGSGSIIWKIFTFIFQKWFEISHKAVLFLLEQVFLWLGSTQAKNFITVRQLGVSK